MGAAFRLRLQCLPLPELQLQLRDSHACIPSTWTCRPTCWPDLRLTSLLWSCLLITGRCPSPIAITRPDFLTYVPGLISDLSHCHRLVWRSGLPVDPSCHLQACPAHLAQVLWDGALAGAVPALLAVLKHSTPCPLGSRCPSLAPDTRVLWHIQKFPTTSTDIDPWSVWSSILSLTGTSSFFQNTCCHSRIRSRWK